MKTRSDKAYLPCIDTKEGKSVFNISPSNI